MEVKSNFLFNLVYRDAPKLLPGNPQLDFEEARKPLRINPID